MKLTAHVVVWLYIATRVSLPFFQSPLRRLPSPPGEKLVLCHLDFNGGKPPTALFEKFVNGTPNDGLLVLWLPLYLSCQVIVTKPDALMDVLNSHSYDWEKPPLIKKVIAGILGEGLVNVEGAKHKAMRRVLAPSFSGRGIRDLAPLFYTKAVGLTDAMARQVRETDDGVLELMALFSRVSLDIIGAAAVGMDFNTIEDEASPLAKLYETVARPPAFFMLVSVMFPKWLLRQLRWTGVARTIQAQDRLKEEVCMLIREKKRLMDQDNSAQHTGSSDIIASIMQSGDFSDDYLVGQLLTFLAAG